VIPAIFWRQAKGNKDVELLAASINAVVSAFIWLGLATRIVGDGIGYDLKDNTSASGLDSMGLNILVPSSVAKLVPS
jgi:hypothetical protein